VTALSDERTTKMFVQAVVVAIVVAWCIVGGLAYVLGRPIAWDDPVEVYGYGEAPEGPMPLHGEETHDVEQRELDTGDVHRN
jgi:hypothetical protein